MTQPRFARAATALTSIALALASPAAHAARAPSSAASDLGLTITHHELGNGLRIYLCENHTVPTMSLWTFYRVGSRNERPGITGISHLFEHLMFNGAKKYGPEEFDRALESNGGFSNAFTDKDVTAYYEDFPSSALELVMDLESDRMRDLDLSPKSLATEREVVKEERRFRTDNSIPGKMGELLYAAAYMAHPYHWPVVGWMADIDSIHTDDLVHYFRTFYAPNNCTMILAGDFDSKRALGLIDRYFSSLPRGPAPPPVPDNEPPQTGERRVEHHFPAQAPAFYAGYHIPSVSSADLYPLEVLGTVLGTGESSRLHRRLVYQEQIALSADAGFRWRLDPGLFTVYVEMAPEHAVVQGEKSAYDEITKVAAEGVGERELTKAKNQVRADLLRSLKTNEGRGEQIGTYDLWFGDPKAMNQALARIEAVKAEDVKRVAKQYFDAKNRTVVVLVPEKEGATP